MLLKILILKNLMLKMKDYKIIVIQRSANKKARYSQLKKF